MLEWFEEFWAYVVALVVIFFITMFICKKALLAYTAHKTNFKNEEEEIKRLVGLKEKYQDLTQDVILNADDGELLEGVALSYQIKLQKSTEQEQDFANLPKEVQLIYVLDVFVQDEKEREFFGENGDVLKNLICEAFELIGEDSLAEKTKKIVEMYDVSQEDVSFDEKKTTEFYDYLEKHNICEQIKFKSSRFIKENSEKFLNT
ncbi:MAG: hypothetical protein R3Y27_03635 [Clostridia bacterium]